jgi:putative ABC transport system permease protein
MRSFLGDLRYALRTLSKSPGFALAAALTLALGIGSNAASFSVIDALLLRPYPVEHLDRLQIVRVKELHSSAGGSTPLSFADYLDLKSQARGFDALTAYRFSQFNLSGSVLPERAEGFFVGPGLFAMLGAQPLRGRLFRSEDFEPGQDGVILLGEPLWRSRFAADPEIVGKSVRVNGRPCRIVGVLPETFHYPLGAQVWLPLVFTPAQTTDRGAPHLFTLGRLRDGVSAKQQAQELKSLGAEWARLYPETNARREFTLVPLRAEQYEYTLGLFGLVEVAALFVLALAAANVCGLFVARSLTRETETAIRAALGARRADLFRVTMAETLLIGGLGAVAGVILGARAVDAIRAGMPPGIAIWLAGWNEVRLTGRAAAVSAVLTLAVSGAIAALVALRQAVRPLEESLRPALSSRAGSRKSHRALRWLAVSQVALAAVLLASAGLLAMGLSRVTEAFATHAPETLLTFDVHLPPAAYPDADRQSAFFRRALQELSALPGVEIAAAVKNAPASNVDNPPVRYEIEGRAAPRESDLSTAGLQVASPGYLRAFHVPLLRGRDFSWSDGPASPPVALVSQSVARREFPGGDAVGKRIRLREPGLPAAWTTIVGVVADVRQNWFDLQPPPCVYLPAEQSPGGSFTLALRTKADPLTLAAPARAAIGRLDADLPLGSLGPFRDRIVESLAPVKIIGILLAVFGAAALALALVGVYGVTAQTVARQRHEISIRLALGAAPRGLAAAVVTRALRLTVIGLAVSLPLIVLSAKLLASRIFGLVEPDRMLLAGVFMALLAVGAGAALLPALRTTRVDPIEALRSP